MKAVFTAMGDGTILEQIYDSTARAILAGRLDFIPPFTKPEELEARKAEWKDVEFFFSTWGTPQLDQGQLNGIFRGSKRYFMRRDRFSVFPAPIWNGGYGFSVPQTQMQYRLSNLPPRKLFCPTRGFSSPLFYTPPVERRRPINMHPPFRGIMIPR
jgi:hypothetical protein